MSKYSTYQVRENEHYTTLRLCKYDTFGDILLKQCECAHSNVMIKPIFFQIPEGNKNVRKRGSKMAKSAISSICKLSHDKFIL